jgi:hypothetical protein
MELQKEERPSVTDRPSKKRTRSKEEATGSALGREQVTARKERM